MTTNSSSRPTFPLSRTLLDEGFQKTSDLKKHTRDFVNRTLLRTWGKDESCLMFQVLAQNTIQELQSHLGVPTLSSLFKDPSSFKEFLDDLTDAARMVAFPKKQDSSENDTENFGLFLEELNTPVVSVPRFSEFQIRLLLQENSFPLLIRLLEKTQTDFLSQKSCNLFYMFVSEPLFLLMPFEKREILIKLQVKWLNQFVSVSDLVDQHSLCSCFFERDLSTLRFMQHFYNLEL